MFIIIISTIQLARSQWKIKEDCLWDVRKFQYSTCCDCSWSYTEYFRQATTSSTTANFITCSVPSMSYITLDNTYKSIQRMTQNSWTKGDFLSFDLYFQGTWTNNEVVLEIGSFIQKKKYTAPTEYPITKGFCDSLETDVMTINLTLTNSGWGYLKFIKSDNNNGQVSIRNIGISGYQFQCFPSCSSCTGPEQNQCQACYYEIPKQNICPLCPDNRYYEKYLGCQSNCRFDNYKYFQGFCQSFSYLTFQTYSYSSQVEQNTWQIIYDPIKVDATPKVFYFRSDLYGIFKYNSGIARYLVNFITSQKVYLYGIRIKLIIFGGLQLGNGIRFMFNNTYYSSIYRDSEGIKTGMIIETQSEYGSYSTYSTTSYYDLFMFVDIPQYPIYFSATSNFTNSNVGWGLISIQVTSGLHHINCLIQEVSYECKKCNSNYYVNKQGNCDRCQNDLQKIVGDKCYDFQDETPYSKLLIKEYFDKSNNPDQYSQYKLISKTGVNLLKGKDIYYSYWQQIRIFGGPYVWSQAVFERIHKIEKAHHSISISFQIVYGPSFPSNSKFIYTIETNLPVSCQKSSATANYPDGSKLQTINEKITHKSDQLTIRWECQGQDNEPILAYCGIYKYYIIVHYCQPYCLECSDQNNCINWDQYDSSLIKVSQSECQSQEYYDSFFLKCKSCPTQCQSCKSSIDCIDCKPTYTLTKLGCVCKTNEYDSGSLCISCPEQCEQCLSSSFCLTCSIQKFRTLLNGQCVCFDGYYSISTSLICLRCHLYCKTCLGPSQDNCKECQNIQNIEKVGSTCKCQMGTAFLDQLKICAPCHQTCLTCFRITIDGCLNCDSNLHRVLRGLKCECQSGYYELDNICQNCPIVEDSDLIQCYNLCNGNQLLWHTNICNNCDIGYELILNRCQPQCGDSRLLNSFEECEDGNNNLDDLCYNCKFQCPKHCLTCNSTTTLPCPDICGDGIITGDEECEDGNNIQYDGCYQCKYQCQTSCTKCIMGNCLECLTLGWVVDTSTELWTCKEQCGDNLLVGNEQCEDLNTQDLDGCKDCRYFCRIGCLSCDYSINKCLSCEETGYIPEKFYCRNDCGDGKILNGFYRILS